MRWLKIRRNYTSNRAIKNGKERKKKKQEKKKENFLSRYRLKMLGAQSQSGHRLLFAVACESREKAENGKLFKRASTQWAKKTSPVEGGTSQGEGVRQGVQSNDLCLPWQLAPSQRYLHSLSISLFPYFPTIFRIVIHRIDNFEMFSLLLFSWYFFVYEIYVHPIHWIESQKLLIFP